MNGTRNTARRRPWTGLLAIAFVAVPLLEIYVVIQVGQVIGAWWTVLLLAADSLIGAWVVKREGGRAWHALTGALSSGRMPATEIADGALVLVGGTLLLTPGFVTDVVGFLLLLPFSRPLVRRLLARTVARRLLVVDMTRPGPRSGGSVVRGEVVDD